MDTKINIEEIIKKNASVDVDKIKELEALLVKLKESGVSFVDAEYNISSPFSRNPSKYRSDKEEKTVLRFGR